MARVEFTLKFENYVDWTRNIHVPARPSFVKRALTLSLLLISLGFLFARWSTNDAPPAGAIAVIVGFLLTLLCLQLWLLIERPRPEKEELHSFSPKQLVEFRNLLRASSNPAFQGISC